MVSFLHGANLYSQLFLYLRNVIDNLQTLCYFIGCGFDAFPIQHVANVLHKHDSKKIPEPLQCNGSGTHRIKGGLFLLGGKAFHIGNFYSVWTTKQGFFTDFVRCGFLLLEKCTQNVLSINLI